MQREIRILLVACALTLSPQTATPQNASPRTVQIVGVRLLPDRIQKGTSKCVQFDVAVETNTTTLADGPRLVLSGVKSSSMPAEMGIDPAEEVIDATLSGPAIFHLGVCPREGAWTIAGKIKVSAAILGVGPEGKFKILEAENAIAELTVDP